MTKFIPRLLYDDDLSLTAEIALTQQQQHYLRVVLNKKKGDEFHLFNSNDGQWQCFIDSIDKKNITIRVQKLLQHANPTPPLSLAFANIKPKALEFMIRKAVELGASHLQPIICAQAQYDFPNNDKIQSWIIDAVQQSGRFQLPILAEKIAFEDIRHQATEQQNLWIACENDCISPQYPIKQLLQQQSCQQVIILIGPTGGFHEREFSLMQQWANDHQYIKIMSLGKHIMRAETAAIAALSCWQAISGDWAS